MRILLIGGSGQIGRALQEQARGRIEVVAPGRAALDLVRPETLAIIAAAAPGVVVNAAAYSRVDAAEDDPAAAFAINRDGVAALARACAAADVPLIHLSTDYVFDGRRSGAYAETDSPDPPNLYGRSKLAGENALRGACRRHVILRTAWVFGPWGQNFAATILARAAQGGALRVVDDQRGCPTPAAAVARALVALAERIERGEAIWGTYHFAGQEPATWHALAAALLEAARPWLPRPPALAAISSAAYGARAARPANSALDCGLITRRLGIAPPLWRASVPEVARQIGLVLGGASR